MRESYKISLLLIISSLITLIVTIRLYILIIPTLFLSAYLAYESKIPEIKNRKTLYEYVKKIYGKDVASLIMKKFKVFESSLTSAYFPTTLNECSIVISNENLILKINSDVMVLDKYEGIDFLATMMKRNVNICN